MSITTSQLVINSTNYDKNENYFVVPFGVPPPFFNMQMSVSQINIFNSFSNISTELGNNWITINFPDGTGFKPYTFTIPSGFYNQVTFLAWLKTQFIHIIVINVNYKKIPNRFISEFIVSSRVLLFIYSNGF